MDFLKINRDVIEEFRANGGACGGPLEGAPMILGTGDVTVPFLGGEVAAGGDARPLDPPCRPAACAADAWCRGGSVHDQRHVALVDRRSGP